jgi:NAD+ synthase (glutamine-hydrolysing)
MIGGQDELVFDGDSLVVGADGELLARASQFTDEVLIVDLSLPQRPAVTPAGNVERIVISSEPLEPYEPLPPAIAERLIDAEELYGPSCLV